MTDTTEATRTIAAETMLGDLISLVIDELKAAPKPWPQLSQMAQDQVIDRVERQCKHAVDQAVHIIASEARATVMATLESITVKDGIKAVLNLSKGDPKRHELIDCTGQQVLVVIANTEAFIGGDRPQSDPDQLGLSIDADTPVADHAGGDA